MMEVGIWMMIIFILKIMKSKQYIRKLIREELNRFQYKPVNVNRFAYHTSNPIFRDNISKEGLIPKEKSEAWLSDTKIDGKVIFAVNSDEKEDWWDSTYDDDIYQIDTTKISNKWFEDPNFSNDEEKYAFYNGKKIKLPNIDSEHYRVITFESIPVDAIKLIYKGTGESSF